LSGNTHFEWIRTPQDEQRQDLGDFPPFPLGTPVAFPIVVVNAL